MTKILHVVGARPNFVKMAPVIRQVRERAPATTQVLVHTGQHYDRRLSDVFVEELELPRPDYFLDVGSGSHAEQTARALERMEAVLQAEQPDVVVVPGDVNSTLAAALAAVKLGIPIAHVEAGLRSFDRTMPEEVNRVLVDQISHWCFTHSPEAEENLLREGIARDRIHFVGNTMIDTLVRLRRRIDASDVHGKLGIEPYSYILVTLHRPSLVDGPLLDRAVASLIRLSKSYKVVFPVHPRTRNRMSVPEGAPGFLLVDPVGYVDFLALELRAAAVLTDSGGVQEETTFLRVPCFTLRANTERPITVMHGTNRVLGLDVRRIEQIPEMLSSTKLRHAPPPPRWDGIAAERLTATILAPLAKGSDAACAVFAAR
jgi:UDP-N-acetylglucosamine 2-epimerase (non-hydrolysing)